MHPLEKVKFDLPVEAIAMMDEAVASEKYLSRDDMLTAVLSEWQKRQKIFGKEFLSLLQKCEDKGLSPKESFDWMTDIAKSYSQFQLA